MNIRFCVACALCVGAAIQLFAPSARAQVEPPTAPTSAEIWARYQECEPRLKPVEQDEFQRLSTEERPAFLDAHCASAPAPGAPEPASEPANIVAVARFEDRDGSMKNDEILSTLDSTLWSTFSGRKQSRYRVVRLEPAPPGCGLKCALEAARAGGATYLVRGGTQWVADGLLATIEIISVQTGAQLHARRSEHVLEAGFLVESTAEAISRAADHLFEIEDAQAAAKSPKVSKPILAVAHLVDAVPGLQDGNLFFSLDDALYSAVAGLHQSRFRIGRLPRSEGPCQKQCAIDAAKSAGAMYVVTSAIEREGDRLRVVASISSVSNGWSVLDTRSMWVTELPQLRHGVDQITREITIFLVKSSQPAGRPRAVAWGASGTQSAADVAGAMAAYRQKTLDSPEYAEARTQRNGGIVLFVLGFIIDSVGVGLLEGGLVVGSTALVVSGAIAEGVGTIMFFTGLGVWVSNQIRMNKIERGIPLGRSLRLEGLSPIVASRGAGAPGLSARFSF